MRCLLAVWMACAACGAPRSCGCGRFRRWCVSWSMRAAVDGVVRRPTRSIAYPRIARFTKRPQLLQRAVTKSPSHFPKRFGVPPGMQYAVRDFCSEAKNRKVRALIEQGFGKKQAAAAQEAHGRIARNAQGSRGFATVGPRSPRKVAAL